MAVLPIHDFLVVLPQVVLAVRAGDQKVVWLLLCRDDCAGSGINGYRLQGLSDLLREEHLHELLERGSSWVVGDRLSLELGEGLLVQFTLLYCLVSPFLGFSS